MNWAVNIWDDIMENSLKTEKKVIPDFSGNLFDKGNTNIPRLYDFPTMVNIWSSDNNCKWRKDG